MDPVRNPYQPGAGSPPPELAGRDKLRAQIAVGLARIRIGRSAKSVLLVGLRGTGKTVLLEQIRKDAESEGIHSLRLEAPEGRSLPALLAPHLRLELLRLSRVDAAKDLTKRAFRALAGFARGLKLKYEDIEVGLDLDPEPGLADNGDLETDLAVLLSEVGQAAKRAETAVAIFIDELQYVPEPQLAALIAALHRVAQDQLPVTVVGAGLPQLRANTGNAKSYAERLFDFPEIGPLPDAEARRAIVKPSAEEGVQFELRAVEAIIEATKGYPYFLQEWGKRAWDVAERSPITVADVERASVEAVAALDESFFRVRFDRITPAERLYLRAMAELGEGPHRSGDIAAKMKKRVSALGVVRESLIAKGMIWSPAHGDTAFTVPMFHEFMKRIVPEFEP